MTSPRVLFGLSLFTILAGAWTATAVAGTTAARKPSWGFESPHPLSRSLVFDQAGETRTVRPAPVTLPRVVVAQEQLVAHSVHAALPSRPTFEASRLESSPFQVTLRPHETRTVDAFENVLRVPATPARSLATAEAVIPVVPATPLTAPSAPAPTEQPQQPEARAEPTPAAIVAPTTPKALKPPKVARDAIRVFVLDEEALFEGRFQTVPDAQVEWVGANAGLKVRVGEDGIVKNPYPRAVSARFVVRAPGYLPAVSYATAGVLSPVVLIKEARLPALLKSLNIVPDPSRRIVVGKVLSKNLKPLERMTIDANVSDPFRSYYSMGSMGLFHPSANQTGPQGDFLITGIGSGLQYLMPTRHVGESAREWPAHLVDFTGIAEVSTTTIVEGESRAVDTQVVDVFALERPETPIHLTIGGQRGVHLPDADGEVKIDGLHARNSLDLIDVRAQGYIRTWLSALPSSHHFPSAVNLFTRTHIERIFREDLHDVALERGMAFGHLRPEIFRNPVSILVFDSRGRLNRDAKVFYFDENNVARMNLDRTNTLIQNFAVTNLQPGEWHIVAIDPKTKKGVAIQVVRTDRETISQLQF